MAMIFIHADPRIPKSEVDDVGEKLLLWGEQVSQPWKIFIEDPETGWERVYAIKKIREGRYSMTFTIGSSRRELYARPGAPGAPPVFSLTRYRMQQSLGMRGRVLDPGDLPSYRFPYVVRRLLSGAHQILILHDISESADFRRLLQDFADILGMPLFLVVDEHRAYHFEPGKPPGRFTQPPPRGGIWLPPLEVQ